MVRAPGPAEMASVLSLGFLQDFRPCWSPRFSGRAQRALVAIHPSPGLYNFIRDQSQEISAAFHPDSTKGRLYQPGPQFCAFSG